MSELISQENMQFLKHAEEILSTITTTGKIPPEDNFFLLLLNKDEAFAVHHTNLELIANIMLNWLNDNGFPIEFETEGGDAPQYMN